jgi:DNA-binding transcriptional regulator GbsR (MarR family)
VSKDRAVTIKDLMRMTGLSADAVEAAFREAEEAGLVRREKTPLGYAVTFTDPATGLPIPLPRAKS